MNFTQHIRYVDGHSFAALQVAHKLLVTINLIIMTSQISTACTAPLKMKLIYV